MKNSDFIKGIVNGSITAGAHGNLSIRDGVVFSYAAPIAYFTDVSVVVTQKKYSVTTSRHTNSVAREAASQGKDVVYTLF